MSNKSRPFLLRVRPDLSITREILGGRTCVVVKDPIALRYFRLSAEESQFLELLDGTHNLEEIQEILESRCSPRKFHAPDLARFVGKLQESGLLLAELPQQGQVLWRRRGEWLRTIRTHRLINPFSIRLRGIDPSRLFEWLYSCFRWCFTTVALASAAMLIVAALLLFAINYQEVVSRLPTWREFFTPSNVMILLTATAAVKILHEFGHGLTCRHFGGEVHELGVMFMLFAPCLYCNVTDSWRLPKSARIAISAAGIVIELTLAAFATFGWWFSQPGLFHQLCFGTMCVSGFSTLLINGNPLMRYDGYFILADLLEQPNLAERSTKVLRRNLAALFFGPDIEVDQRDSEQGGRILEFYALASIIYRFFLLFSIVLLLVDRLRPYNLEVVARLMGMVIVSGALVKPICRLIAFGRKITRGAGIDRARVFITTLGVVLAVVLFFQLSVPQCVWATLELEPNDSERIYVEVGGVVTGPTVCPGETIAVGTVLARLSNLDLEYEIAKLEGEIASSRAELASVKSERFHNDAAALRVGELEEAITGLQEILQERCNEFERLVLRATRSGVVFPAIETTKRMDSEVNELQGWWGLPTDVENQGATLAPGTLLCQISDPCKWQAILVVDQSDIELVALNQTVEIRFDERPNVIVVGVVEEISSRELIESPRHISTSAGGDLLSKADSSGIQRPVSSTYQLRVVLYDPEQLLRIGLRGTARIQVDPQPLAARLGRWLDRTFHFDL